MLTNIIVDIMTNVEGKGKYWNKYRKSHHFAVMRS